MLKSAVAAILLAVPLLAGCAEESRLGGEVTIRFSDVNPQSGSSRILQCPSHADLNVRYSGNQGGSLTVKVREGSTSHVLIHHEEFRTRGDVDVTIPLDGGSGYWELEVHRSLEWSGGFTISLSC